MPMLFIVREIYPLAEGGAVLSGRIDSGVVREGQPVAFTSRAGHLIQACVVTIERAADRTLIPRAEAGEDVRLLLPEISPSAVAVGTVLQEIAE